MRRSICYVEPEVALAGEPSNWKFMFTPATSLPKGTRLKFDLQTQGRDVDWEMPQVNVKNSSNVIFGMIDESTKPIPAKLVELPTSFTPQFEFKLPEKLDAGKPFTIFMGNPKPTKSSKPESFNCAQTYTQRRRPFLLYVDPTGKGHYQDPEVFNLDIRGNELSNIRVLSPSFVTKNKRFDVIIRFEDDYGNLTSNASEDTLIELSYENFRENLNWKLFVPETGFLSIPNLYFNEPGIYTLQLKILSTGQTFYSSPIKCFADYPFHLYWGTLHGESERVDSSENIESCLRHFRDDKAYNFFATSNFEHSEETPSDIWKLVGQNISDFNENERFTTFTGFQWVGEPSAEGLRQFVFQKDAKNILRQKDTKSNSLKKIYKAHSPKEMISIPSFTMGSGFSYDFKNYNQEFERVVEIYNAWGSSEVTKKEGNSFPIAKTGKSGISAVAEGAIIPALNKNNRFGFVAGGLDDRGIYATLFDSTQEQYFPGLTAIVAEQHSRESIFEALYNRSCYATTGERILLGLTLSGTPMGGEISTVKKPGLKVNRHLAGYVIGTSNLKKVEIVRNGKVLHTLKPDGDRVDIEYDDLTPLQKGVIDAKDGKVPFAYYFLRVTQEDGHMAWSSPIWVDLGGKEAGSKGSDRKSKSS